MTEFQVTMEVFTGILLVGVGILYWKLTDILAAIKKLDKEQP